MLSARRFRIDVRVFIVIILCFFAQAGFAQTNEGCMECHGDVDMFAPDDEEMAHLFFEIEAFNKSIHDEAEIACVDCHADISEVPHEEELAPVDCGMCHDDTVEIYKESLHGYLRETGDTRAPNCFDCHGSHDILSSSNPESHTHKKNLPESCGICHSGYGARVDSEVRGVRAVEMYLGSVHGKSTAGNGEKAASCSDCHGIHDIKGPIDIASKVNRRNIPETCSPCHTVVYDEYMQSIHGKALLAGISDSPVCTDCHGEHSIQSTTDPESPTYQLTLSEKICADCHEDAELIAKYGLPTETFSTYRDSYHGMAGAVGSGNIATCVSCHGTHFIMPSSNPASSTHADNLVATCAKCHEGAEQGFAESYTHQTQREASNPIDNFVRRAYILLIIFVVGGMLFHNSIILFRTVREKYKYDNQHESIQRFDYVQRAQHLGLMLSFFMLVFTGFALKYPTAWWVQPMAWVGLGEAGRGIAHRISAVVMILTSVAHMFYLLSSAKGRRELMAMMLRPRDLKQAKQFLSYQLDSTIERPDFDKYDYMEKVEYWALIWGTIVMVATGFFLWFPEFFTQFTPNWMLKVMETVHFYEAWLATLSILCWHFFMVFFQPDRYPMSMTMFHGQMSTEEIKHHYKGWYKAMQKENEEGKNNKDNAVKKDV